MDLHIHLGQLPRMADLRCGLQHARRHSGRLARLRAANRRAAVEDLIEADPVAARVRTIMAKRGIWTGSASDLLCVGAGSLADGLSSGGLGWPKNPRALAGRAQVFPDGPALALGSAARVLPL